MFKLMYYFVASLSQHVSAGQASLTAFFVEHWRQEPRTTNTQSGLKGGAVNREKGTEKVPYGKGGTYGKAAGPIPFFVAIMNFCRPP
jgi:hypothetical protein